MPLALPSPHALSPRIACFLVSTRQGSSGRLIYTFTTKASLQTAVQAYNTSPTAAIAEYGPVAEWDVSAITDMSWLFDSSNFNADISNWDTSSVTNMYHMFYVRSARALAPHSLESGPPRTCRLRRHHPAPSRLPSHASRMPAPFDPAGRVRVQPSAQLRHVQGHKHEQHVLRALRACPGPHSLESGPPRARRMRRRHPTPSRLPGRTSSRIACPPFDSAVRVRVQPAAQLRHLQGHKHALHVRGALRACPGRPSLESGPPRAHAACVAAIQRPHASRATPLLAPHARLSTRQAAKAFNQPLSFDTSKVTDMEYMFYVRSARALAPVQP